MSTRRSPPQPSVLIVDQSADSREVIRTALHRRGFGTFEAEEARSGLELIERYQPDLVVLDLEAAAGDEDSFQLQYDDTSSARGTPLVVIGKARPVASAQPWRRDLAKPYHYRLLIRTIEQMLAHAVEARTPG